MLSLWSRETLEGKEGFCHYGNKVSAIIYLLLNSIPSNSEATVSSSTGTNVQEEELIAEGRRSLVCNDFSSAVLAFQEACQIMYVTLVRTY